MKFKILTLLLIMFPVAGFADSPNCDSWPKMVSEQLLQNRGIVKMSDLDRTKTESTLLASEKKQKGLYTQIYYLVFHDKQGKTYQVITKNDASHQECSETGVEAYLIQDKLSQYKLN